MRPSMPQIQTNKQPITQITIVESEPDKQAEALRVMAERARFMARQPGFISVSLHRSLDGRRIVNYIQWQSRDLLRSAHQSPEFRKEWGQFANGQDRPPSVRASSRHGWQSVGRPFTRPEPYGRDSSDMN